MKKLYFKINGNFSISNQNQIKKLLTVSPPGFEPGTCDMFGFAALPD